MIPLVTYSHKFLHLSRKEEQSLCLLKSHILHLKSPYSTVKLRYACCQSLMPIRTWFTVFLEKHLYKNRCSCISLLFYLVPSDEAFCALYVILLGRVNFLSVREIQDVTMTLHSSIQLGSVIKTALK